MRFEAFQVINPSKWLLFNKTQILKSIFDLRRSFMNNKAEKSVKLCSDFLSPEACRIRLDIYNLFPHLTCQTSPWTLPPVSPSPPKMSAYSQMSRKYSMFCRWSVYFHSKLSNSFSNTVSKCFLGGCPNLINHTIATVLQGQGLTLGVIKEICFRHQKQVWS